MWEVVLLAGLAVAGLAYSLYFLLLYYHKITSTSRFVPQFCHLKEGTCDTVIFTSYGRVFGFPNSWLGIGFYLFLLCVAVTKPWQGHFLYRDIALLGSVLSNVFGVYLIHALVVRLKTPCPL